MSRHGNSPTGASSLLVEVWRGPIVESRHRGHLTAEDGDGKTVASLGSPETITYVRSSGKPFQALPLIVSGAADRFNFSEQEIETVGGAHSGEALNVQTPRSMLRKAGLQEDSLRCGVHEPFSVDVAREL